MSTIKTIYNNCNNLLIASIDQNGRPDNLVSNWQCTRIYKKCSLRGCFWRTVMWITRRDEVKLRETILKMEDQFDRFLQGRQAVLPAIQNMSDRIETEGPLGSWWKTCDLSVMRSDFKEDLQKAYLFNERPLCGQEEEEDFSSKVEKISLWAHRNHQSFGTEIRNATKQLENNDGITQNINEILEKADAIDVKTAEQTRAFVENAKQCIDSPQPKECSALEKLNEAEELAKSWKKLGGGCCTLEELYRELTNHHQERIEEYQASLTAELDDSSNTYLIYSPIAFIANSLARKKPNCKKLERFFKKLTEGVENTNIELLLQMINYQIFKNNPFVQERLTKDVPRLAKYALGFKHHTINSCAILLVKTEVYKDPDPARDYDGYPISSEYIEKKYYSSLSCRVDRVGNLTIKEERYFPNGFWG